MRCDDFSVWPDGVLKLFHVIFPGLSMIGIILSTALKDQHEHLGYHLAHNNDYIFVFEFWRVTTLIACVCGFITLVLWWTALEGPRKYVVIYSIIVYYSVMTTLVFMSTIFGILHLVHAGEWYKCHTEHNCSTLTENAFFWMIVMAMICSTIALFSYCFTVVINLEYLKTPSTIIPGILERTEPLAHIFDGDGLIITNVP